MHNKLEKNRRAQLKGRYEELKKELPLRDEDRKKTSNLNILDKAHKLVVVRSHPHLPTYLPTSLPPSLKTISNTYSLAATGQVRSGTGDGARVSCQAEN